LRSILEMLMKEDMFEAFRLVGGTGLSLQLGHRESDDIDLFTDVEYGTIDFEAIKNYLNGQFSYLETFDSGAIGHGKSFFVGESKDQSIKLDICYTDPFIRPILNVDDDFDPVCLRGKYWELIKLDIAEALDDLA